MGKQNSDEKVVTSPTIYRAPSVYIPTVFHRTGFPILDYYIGSTMNIHDKDGKFVKQVPMLGQAGGTTNLFVGGTQSGKTTLACQDAANVTRPFPESRVRHWDAEGRYNITRCQNITGLPLSAFTGEDPKYMIVNEIPTLQGVLDWVTTRYTEKVTNPKKFMFDTGTVDEFGNPVSAFIPDVGLIDSIAAMLTSSFDPEKQKEVDAWSELKSRGEGPGTALTLTEMMKKINPLCKKANINIYGINHVKIKIEMNMFKVGRKEMPFMNQDDTFPGGRVLKYDACNILQLSSTSDNFYLAEDGFNGRLVMVEPIKASYNISGSKRTGVYFELVFTNDHGFDPLRSLIHYGRQKGIIDGNRGRLHFKGHDEFVFSWKNIDEEKKEKPIWECVRECIYPELDKLLPYSVPFFDENCLM